MLLSQSQMNAITDTLRKELSLYGISLPEQHSELTTMLESTLSHFGVLTESDTSFDDLNGEQHRQWIKYAIDKHSFEGPLDPEKATKAAKELYKSQQGRMSPLVPENANFQMVDWRLPEQSELLSPEHDSIYNVSVDMGNQMSVEFSDLDTGEPVMGMLIEINGGVPSVHIDLEGGDSIVHIHKINDGLVFTPDSTGHEFMKADGEDLIYDSCNSVKLKP